MTRVVLFVTVQAVTCSVFFRVAAHRNRVTVWQV